MRVARQSAGNLVQSRGSSETTRETPPQEYLRGWWYSPDKNIRNDFKDNKVAKHRAIDRIISYHPSPIRKKKGFHQFRFYTKSVKSIGELRTIFYDTAGRKRIPKNIAYYLTNPLTLAVWYQDDGTLDFRDKYHANALIATHCFTFEECQLLARALYKNFNLDVRVCRCQMRGKLYFRLYVTSKSMQLFMQLVKPFIQNCFRYKLLSYRIASQQQR